MWGNIMNGAEIVSIEPYGEAQTYDLKVADNHNFFLANGILTHNSGKDGLTLYIINRDIVHNRTPIILDMKGEYAFSIFSQNDVVLKNLLLKNGLVGRGYKTILWIPYIIGMEEYEHIRTLLKLHHPNLEIRPFRILIGSFLSDDSYNMALAKTQLQALAADDEDYSGSSQKLNALKERMGEEKLMFDRESKWVPGCGWEYINFDEITRNGCVNVITTQFLSTNSIAQTSFNIAVMNELLAISKGVNRVRAPDEVFSIVIPEIEALLPKNVKTLDDSVNTLKFSIRITLLVMRYYDVRLRMNLQNLSALDPGMVSQSILFTGKTWNPRDLKMLRIFNITRAETLKMADSPVGQFYKVIQKERFSVVPFSHKAREREYLITPLIQYKHDPSLFLFETKNNFLSEIVDYQEIFHEAKPLTVPEYNKRVKAWLRKQKDRPVPAILENSADQVSGAIDKYQEASGVKV